MLRSWRKWLRKFKIHMNYLLGLQWNRSQLHCTNSGTHCIIGIGCCRTHIIVREMNIQIRNVYKIICKMLFNDAEKYIKYSKDSIYWFCSKRTFYTVDTWKKIMVIMFSYEISYSQMMQVIPKIRQSRHMTDKCRRKYTADIVYSSQSIKLKIHLMRFFR